jgi:hypothetical protein
MDPQKLQDLAVLAGRVAVDVARLTECAGALQANLNALAAGLVALVADRDDGRPWTPLDN